MRVILFFALLLTATLAQKTSMRNALRNQVVTDFKNAIVPIISKQVAHMVLPDVHSSSSGFKIDVSSIHIEIAAFNGNQISIQFVPGTSAIRFAGSNFGISGGAHVSAKWKFIKKSVNLDISVSHLGFASQITLYSNAGKPNVRVDHVQISLSGGNVSIKIHGGFIAKILQFVINLLKGHIVKHVVSTLQGKLPNMITEQVNKRLNTLPSSMDIGPNLAVRYAFPESPAVRNDYLFTAIGAFVYPKNNPNPPAYDPKATPEFDAQNPKGIQFFMADYVIKTALDATFAIGMMTVALEKNLLQHQIKMLCRATRSPDFNFINAIDAVVDASCEVNFDNVPTNKFGITLQLHVNLREYIKAAVIFFSVGEVKFNKLEYHVANPINIDWFKNGINTVLAAVLEIVNMQLGQRGIPLPTIAGIDYTDIVQFVKAGYMEICVTPVFHISGVDQE